MDDRTKGPKKPVGGFPLGESFPLIVIDDPIVERPDPPGTIVVDSLASPPESTRVDSPKAVRVSRELGVCDFCLLAGGQVIRSHTRVFDGLACPGCVLSGKASDKYPPHHESMRPLVFVARALRGDQPFKDLLRAAESQGAEPAATARAKARAVTNMKPTLVSGNRRQRRANQAARVKAKRKEKRDA